MTFVRSLWNDTLRPANGNGDWRSRSMKTRTSSKHAWAREVVVAAAVAGVLVAAVPAPAVVKLKIATTDGIAGGKVTLTMSIDRKGVECPNGNSDCPQGPPAEVCVNGFCEPPAITGAQADVVFDTAQLGMSGFCSEPPNASVVCETGQDCVPTDVNFCEDLPCQPDPRLTGHLFAASLPPFQNVPPGQRRLRLALPTDIPPVPFTDGLLATCTFDVPGAAAPGQINLSPTRLNVSNEFGDPLPVTAVVESGFIVVPTPTVTGTPPTATPTVTGTPPTATVTGTPPTPTVTGTPPTATVTGTPPTATVTGTPPTATVTGTPPTATVTGTPPTATVTGTPPTATVTGTPPTATVTGTPPTATPTGTPPTATPSGTPTEIPCVGDCYNDGKVTQADLVIGTGIALETTPYGECPQFDRDHNNAVTVDEIVEGINNFALPVCPVPPAS